MVESPALEVAAALSHAVLAKSEVEVGCAESLSPLERIGRGIRIDAADNAKGIVVVNLESKTEVARPADGTHNDTAFVLAHLAAQAYFKERLGKHIGASAKPCVDNLATIIELAFLHLHLLGPVASKLVEEILAVFEIKH